MLHLLVNPVAAHGRCVALAARIESALKEKGLSYRILFTEAPHHATELCRRLALEGSRLILCAGGDGTAFEAAHGLLGSKTPLGVLPCGTGNDFARTLGLPANLEQALDVLLAGSARAVDVGYIEDRLFLNSCGTGFDAETVRAAQKAKFLGRGMLPYLYGVFDTLLHYEPREMRIQIDGEAPVVRRCLLCLVANGQYIGGGMRMSPLSRIDDGLLDLVYVDPLPRRKIVQLLPKMIRGRHMGYTDIVHHVRCRRATLECPGMLMQCDGELRTLDVAPFSVDPARLLLQMP